MRLHHALINHDDSHLQIILTQSSKVLSLECEMSAVHGLLSRIPDTLSHEQMIMLAYRLFEKHPPSTLAKNARLKPNAK